MTLCRVIIIDVATALFNKQRISRMTNCLLFLFIVICKRVRNYITRSEITQIKSIAVCEMLYKPIITLTILAWITIKPIITLTITAWVTVNPIITLTILAWITITPI